MIIYEVAWVEGCHFNHDLYDTENAAWGAMHEIYQKFKAKYPNLVWDEYENKYHQDIIKDDWISVFRNDDKGEFHSISIYIYKKELNPAQSTYV